MRTLAGYRRIALSAALCACSSALWARDLGVVGPAYPVAERSLLEVIQERLEEMRRSGELERLQAQARERAQAWAERPRGTALPRASAPRVRYVDPAITVPYDITDHEGRVIHRAGTTVNPLDHITLSRRLVFFDGDDPDQVRWARALLEADPAGIKPILTNGPVAALMRQWQARIYFDQHGALIKHFGIAAVPTVISQAGRRLKVEEIVLGDTPDRDRPVTGTGRALQAEEIALP